MISALSGDFLSWFKEIKSFYRQIENRPKEVGVLVDWSSCVICLEVFPPHLLQSHENCNMVCSVTLLNLQNVFIALFSTPWYAFDKY
jgi:hypothetical protein